MDRDDSTESISDGRDVSDSQLQSFTESVFESDENNSGRQVILDVQEKAGGGTKSLRPLFKVERSVWEKETYDQLLRLYADESSKEVQRNFLKTIVKTNVMVKTKKFLQKVGAFKGDDKDFEKFLHKMWFTEYRRSGVTSSGFKHVFMAERKGSSTVNGLHNWIYFSKEEAKRNIEYLGWIFKGDFHKSQGSVIGMKYRWMELMKELGSMMVGTSPELEFAVYTTCFLLRPNRVARISMGGLQLQVQTYAQNNAGENVISTAYPKL